MRRILLVLAALLATSAAHATCTSPISSLNSTGATITLGATVDASNNCWGGTAIVDGTAAANKMAVKAASTAPLAADPAAVVALSPNSVGGVVGTPLFAQITTGAAVIGSISNTSFIATQATAANLNATVVGTGTFAVQLNTTPTIANGNGVVPTQSGIALSAGNPSFAALSIGGSLDSATNGIYANVLQGNATLSATNGVFANILQGNAALSGSNPSFAALSIGSAVDSATNGIYVNLLQGNAVNANGNPIFASVTNTVAISASALPLPTGASTSANQTTELASLATIATNTGAAIPAGTNLIGAVNVSQVGGSAYALGSTTASASAPVVLASNQTAGDPCMFQAKTNVPISTASGTTALVAGVSAKKVYVCSLSLISPTAVSVSLSEGSGTTCGTSAQAGVIGVATNGTAANGMPLAANGGLTLGNGGGTVAATATAANYLCLFQSGTAQLAGNLTFVQQ